MAPVGRELARSFHVLEPWQRRSGPFPLTVSQHVEDLRDLVRDQLPGQKPAVVGSSWGAMLALAHAARYLAETGPIVLIGCGTFDRVARSELAARLDARMTASLRSRLASLLAAYPDADERRRVEGELLLPLYCYDLVEPPAEGGPCDARGAEESWNDMLRRQAEGVYPAAFGSIHVPVLMLHGAYDPHPGRRILEGLRPILPQIEYREWERCGHYPWLERATRSEFYEVLTEWLTQHTERRSDGPE